MIAVTCVISIIIIKVSSEGGGQMPIICKKQCNPNVRFVLSFSVLNSCLEHQLFEFDYAVKFVHAYVPILKKRFKFQSCFNPHWYYNGSNCNTLVFRLPSVEPGSEVVSFTTQ